MSGRPPILLKLATLSEVARLSRSRCETFAAAASVALERAHGVRDVDAATVLRDEAAREATIVRTGVDDIERATWADPNEATEDGAVGIAILVAREELGLVAFRRLVTGTGADYCVAAPTHGDDEYERLECSGLAKGEEPAGARLRSKLKQMARGNDKRPGWAVVTDFKTEPVDIRMARWP
jgi:hypothetical protein